MLSKEERRQQRFQRELLTCKHFNGVYGPGMTEHSCRAGVDYRAHVGGEDTGWITRLPCTPKLEDRSGVVSCSLREFPTIEDVEREEAETEAAFKATSEAIKLCRDDAKGKRGVAGEVKCPKCAGRLRYTVSGYNGHLWGQCDTKGCLAWMM